MYQSLDLPVSPLIALSDSYLVTLTTAYPQSPPNHSLTPLTGPHHGGDWRAVAPLREEHSPHQQSRRIPPVVGPAGRIHIRESLLQTREIFITLFICSDLNRRHNTHSLFGTH